MKARSVPCPEPGCGAGVDEECTGTLRFEGRAMLHLSRVAAIFEAEANKDTQPS